MAFFDATQEISALEAQLRSRQL